LNPPNIHELTPQARGDCRLQFEPGNIKWVRRKATSESGAGYGDELELWISLCDEKRFVGPIFSREMRDRGHKIPARNADACSGRQVARLAIANPHKRHRALVQVTR
jgi:hypothetical protein